MKKNVVKMNENTLRRIVAESVKKVLKEGEHERFSPEAYQALYKVRDILAPIAQADETGDIVEIYSRVTVLLDEYEFWQN